MFGARIQDLRPVIYLASSVLSLCHLFCCHGVLGQNSWNFQRLLDQLISVDQIILAA
jgi:hypothetical protein